MRLKCNIVDKKTTLDAKKNGSAHALPFGRG
jgi:hypothetical protein